MKKYLFFISLFVLAFAACKKNGLDNVGPEQLKSILLGKDTLTMYAGEVEQINFTTNPTDFNLKELTWKSSDSTVVAVTDGGKITALKPGLAKITISNKVNTVSVSCLISVIATPPKTDSLKVGLIAWYAFNNSAADSSGHGNNGTVFGAAATTNRFGTANSAYYFNGASSYISVPDKSELRLNNTDFSLNYWVNLDEYISTSGSAILAKNSGPYQNGWNTAITGKGYVGDSTNNFGHVFYNVSGGDDPFAIGNGVVDLAKWTMVTVLYSNSKQTITFYVNGNLDNAGDKIPTPNPNTTVNLFIGKNSYNDPSGLTPPYYLKGKLDDIRIYDRMLTVTDIHKLLDLTY